VETTTAYGFDPGTRREAVDSFTGRTGFSYVPPGNYRQRQDIGEKELISLIYQNRLAALQRQRKWEEAVGIAADRRALAGSEAAENDFRVSITNYAADLDRRKKELEGLDFLNDAAAVLGEGHGLEDTASALLGNAVTYYLREGRISEALTHLDDEELTALVPDDFISRRRQEVREKSLEITLKTAPFEEASAAVNQAYSEDLITESRWEEFTMYLWSNEARRRASGGNWLEGWLFLEDAPSEYAEIRGWSRMADNYSHNAVIVYHNRFAGAFRNGDYTEAREILDEALNYFPDSPMLLRDRTTLDELQ
jgi:tetratricopeptide (TPR) repeat protein